MDLYRQGNNGLNAVSSVCKTRSCSHIVAKPRPQSGDPRRQLSSAMRPTPAAFDKYFFSPMFKPSDDHAPVDARPDHWIEFSQGVNNTQQLLDDVANLQHTYFPGLGKLQLVMKCADPGLRHHVGRLIGMGHAEFSAKDAAINTLSIGLRDTFDMLGHHMIGMPILYKQHQHNLKTVLAAGTASMGKGPVLQPTLGSDFATGLTIPQGEDRPGLMSARDHETYLLPKLHALQHLGASLCYENTVPGNPYDKHSPMLASLQELLTRVQPGPARADLQSAYQELSKEHQLKHGLLMRLCSSFQFLSHQITRYAVSAAALRWHTRWLVGQEVEVPVEWLYATLLSGKNPTAGVCYLLWRHSVPGFNQSVLYIGTSPNALLTMSCGNPAGVPGVTASVPCPVGGVPSSTPPPPPPRQSSSNDNNTGCNHSPSPCTAAKAIPSIYQCARALSPPPGRHQQLACGVQRRRSLSSSSGSSSMLSGTSSVPLSSPLSSSQLASSPRPSPLGDCSDTSGSISPKSVVSADTESLKGVPAANDKIRTVPGSSSSNSSSASSKKVTANNASKAKPVTALTPKPVDSKAAIMASQSLISSDSITDSPPTKGRPTTAKHSSSTANNTLTVPPVPSQTRSAEDTSTGSSLPPSQITQATTTTDRTSTGTAATSPRRRKRGGRKVNKAKAKASAAAGQAPSPAAPSMLLSSSGPSSASGTGSSPPSSPSLQPAAAADASDKATPATDNLVPQAQPANPAPPTPAQPPAAISYAAVVAAPEAARPAAEGTKGAASSPKAAASSPKAAAPPQATSAELAPCANSQTSTKTTTGSSTNKGSKPRGGPGSNNHQRPRMLSVSAVPHEPSGAAGQLQQ